MAFKVLKPGMLTLLQDLGRHGYQHLGVTSGGPMDEVAFRWGNALLDNPDNAPQLEITFGMLSLEATQPTSIAIAGADLGATINGETVMPWQTYEIKTGDVLNFQQPKFGLRAYLAVKGGFLATPVLGSVATVMRESLGGFDGKGSKVQKGDLLPFHATSNHTPRHLPRLAIPNYEQAEIDVVTGYQYTRFSGLDRARFFNSDYTLSQNCDRMGYRLEGQAVGQDQPGIISEGIAYGAIQIPSDGNPIVLLRDRQTIGGYPKIGCVTSISGGLLAQKKPGDKIGFRYMTIDQAERERHLTLARIHQWR